MMAGAHSHDSNDQKPNKQMKKIIVKQKIKQISRGLAPSMEPKGTHKHKIYFYETFISYKAEFTVSDSPSK